MTRLGKYLASCSISSRRKSEDIILKGLVKVNNNIVKDPAFIISDKDIVFCDGKIIKPSKPIVIALNKPKGYLSTCKDDFNRKTVLDLIKNITPRLYPVGRLDLNSRGLILLTNDGDLAYKFTHPKFNISKTYLIRLNKPLLPEDVLKIRNGVSIEGRKLFIKKMKIHKNDTCEISISEGRKRILRKLFLSLGYKVIDLKRIKIGSLSIKDLKEGNYRFLDSNDIELIQKNN